MSPGQQLDEIKTLLARHGQSQLLAHWDRLAPLAKADLLRQIAVIDFALLERLHRDPGATTDRGALAARAMSLPAVRLSERSDEARTAEALRWGEAALSAGNLGVILVAGGQGTRLGFDRPKGMFAIGPVSGHSLFQILVEKVVAIRRRYGQPTPLYIMTSPATHNATVEYFDRVARFGLPESDVKFFCQGTMPAIDRATGRVLLAGPGQIALRNRQSASHHTAAPTAIPLQPAAHKKHQEHAGWATSSPEPIQLPICVARRRRITHQLAPC